MQCISVSVLGKLFLIKPNDENVLSILAFDIIIIFENLINFTIFSKSNSY